jgi:hypothetical protein
MMNTRILLLGAALALSTTSTVFAQPNERVAEAQRAYADVDYEATRRLARVALERGGNDRAATGQLYLLWAMAAAALDQNDEARSAFSSAIAVNPELKLDRSVSPKIRAPYLEARGAMTSADGQAPLEVKVQQRRQGLDVELRDTLKLAASIELSLRAREGTPYIKRKLAAAPSRRVALPEGSELQAFALVLDRYGNVIAQVGSADDPERLLLIASQKPQRQPEPGRRDVNRTPYYISAGAMGVLGLAAGGVATVMLVKREDAAKEWNGSGCEQPGMTRLQQCGAVDDRRQRSENLAIGFGAAGGALLVGSALSLLLAPSPQQPSVALDAGPQTLMLRLGAKL